MAATSESDRTHVTLRENADWIGIEIAGVPNQTVGVLVGDATVPPTLVIRTVSDRPATDIFADIIGNGNASASHDAIHIPLDGVYIPPDHAGDDGITGDALVQVTDQGHFDTIYIQNIVAGSLAIDYYPNADRTPRLLVHETPDEEPTHIIPLPTTHTTQNTTPEP